jgi:hypothetical protein
MQLRPKSLPKITELPYKPIPAKADHPVLPKTRAQEQSLAYWMANIRNGKPYYSIPYITFD